MISELNKRGEIRLLSNKEREMLMFATGFALCNNNGSISDRLLKRVIVKCFERMRG